jgi:hypothetical protein
MCRSEQSRKEGLAGELLKCYGSSRDPHPLDRKLCSLRGEWEAGEKGFEVQRIKARLMTY